METFAVLEGGGELRLGMWFSLHARSALKGLTIRLVNVAKIFVAVSHIACWVVGVF